MKVIDRRYKNAVGYVVDEFLRLYDKNQLRAVEYSENEILSELARRLGAEQESEVVLKIAKEVLCEIVGTGGAGRLFHFPKERKEEMVERICDFIGRIHV